ncbi:TAXI family TRAP transporter solute-binding subunit [Haloferula chungangensis]|uniref:TAXI family TRAP transporter solute-binding subunit n=1 Tax=Haloferula chungangensis TaxID=1048331 RepID=A0ABW2LEG2_9BACT
MTSPKPYAALTITFAALLLGLMVFALIKSSRRTELKLSAGQSGGIYNPIATSIAQLIEQADSDIRIEVLESDGSAENATRLSQGTADLALLQNDSPGDDSIRSLVPLRTGALHFLARKDARISSLGELEGRKVGVGLATSGSHRLVTELLHHFEVDLDKVELRPLTIQAASKQLREGEIDALLMVIGFKTDVIDQVIASGEVEFVPIGRHAGPGSVIEGFRLTNPFVEPWLIPRYCYAMPHGNLPGVPDEAIPTLAVRTVLVARQDVPNPVARQITKLVIENRNRLTRMHRDLPLMEDKLDHSKFQFPLHPGATQYYNRNEPGFLLRYAEVIGLLASFLFTSYGLIRTGRRWLLQRQKDRIDAYYSELNRLLDHMLKPMTLDQVRGVEVQLHRIRSTALDLLSRERLLPDESFRIFQTLLAEASAQARAKRQEAKPQPAGPQSD